MINLNLDLKNLSIDDSVIGEDIKALYRRDAYDFTTNLARNLPEYIYLNTNKNFTLRIPGMLALSSNVVEFCLLLCTIPRNYIIIAASWSMYKIQSNPIKCLTGNCSLKSISIFY